MLKKVLSLILIAICLNFGGITQQAIASEHSTLADLVKKADLIFIGRVQQTNWKDVLGHTSVMGMTESSYRTNYSLLVGHVIKGLVSYEGRTLLIKDAPIVNSYSCPEQGSNGMFMLDSHGPDSFEFVDPAHPIFRVASSDSKEENSAAPFVSVVHLLSQFLGSPAKSLRQDDPRGVDWEKQELYAEVAEILKTVPLEFVRSDLHAIVSSSSHNQLQRLLAFDCLLSHEDFDDVEQLKAILSNPPDSSVAPGLTGTIPHGTMITPRGSWLHFTQGWDSDGKQNRLRLSPKFEPAMEKLIAAIEPLLRSRDLCTRQDVADILCEIATPAVINPLAQIALNDPDDYVRDRAICGLKSTVLNEPFHQGASSNGVDRQAIEFWRRWTEFRDQSGSPLVVPKLSDVRPSPNYTARLSQYENPLEQLIPGSELIIVGHLTADAGLAPANIEHKSMADRMRTYYRVSVDRVLKNAGHHDLSHVTVDSVFPAPRDFGMLFLKHVNNNLFEQACRQTFTNGLTPVTCAPAGTTRPRRDSNGTQNVVDELVAVLATPARQIIPKQSPQRSANVKVGEIGATAVAVMTGDGVVRSFIAGHQNQSQFDCSGTDATYTEAAGSLKRLPDSSVIPSLHTMLSSPRLEAQCRLWIANVLVSHGDFQSLNEVKTLLLDPPDSPQYIDPAIRAMARTIEAAGNTQDKNEVLQKQKIEILMSLLHSKNVAVRRAVVRTLARTIYLPDPSHPKEEFLKAFLVPMAKIGLYDPDLEVRSRTVGALVSYTDIGRHKNWGYANEFEKNQAAGVQFWRRMIGIGALSVP